MSQLRPLSADQIGDIGRRLYGEYWQGQLAKALDVNPRLLRYWLSGELQPSPEDERRLIALIEFAAVEAQRRARNVSASREPIPPRGDWSFDPDELEIIDRQVVRHRPTEVEISFYDYPTPPAAGEVAGGTISRMRDMGSADLLRFQAAAWEKMSLFRYGHRRASRVTPNVGAVLVDRRRRLGLHRAAMAGWIACSLSMLKEAEDGLTTVTDWYSRALDGLEEFQRNSPDLFLNARQKMLAAYQTTESTNLATQQPANDLVGNGPGGRPDPVRS
jgi:ribosome-binding protein aMBF1 (putative translation factor)